MPDLGPGGRGGARRRTRRRMMAMEQKRKESEPAEDVEGTDTSNNLEKLARLLKDKGIITEEEFNLIFD